MFDDVRNLTKYALLPAGLILIALSSCAAAKQFKNVSTSESDGSIKTFAGDFGPFKSQGHLREVMAPLSAQYLIDTYPSSEYGFIFAYLSGEKVEEFNRLKNRRLIFESLGKSVGETFNLGFEFKKGLSDNEHWVWDERQYSYGNALYPYISGNHASRALLALESAGLIHSVVKINDGVFGIQVNPELKDTGFSWSEDENYIRFFIPLFRFGEIHESEITYQALGSESFQCEAPNTYFSRNLAPIGVVGKAFFEIKPDDSRSIKAKFSACAILGQPENLVLKQQFIDTIGEQHVD